MKISLKYILSITIFCSGLLSAQVSTGTPSFGSFGGGPADIINLGNLNIHLDLPVFQKAGRGMPFSYDLGYDNSFWLPVTSGSTTQWQPNGAGDWGWSVETAAFSGYVSASTTTTTSNSPCTGTSTQTWGNYVYHDPLGRQHPFALTTWFRTAGCLHPPTSSSGNVSGYATDGSGLKLTANLATWSITDPRGNTITGPMNNLSGSGTVTDSNGNELTSNTSGQYFDTLSSTAPVLTVSGGPSSSPMTLTYTAPGGSAAYTVTYGQYTVATNFSVSGITEYGATTTPLISSILLPDGTSYAFTYEQTPGGSSYCTANGSSPVGYCVTGRIASLTLPAGGEVTYTYTAGGGSTTIFSDGSTAGITRVLCPSSTTCSGAPTWTYSRALAIGSSAVGPGSTWVTTMWDPQGNETLDNFAEDSVTNGTSTVATYNLYPTQQQSYQCSISTSPTCVLGTESLLATTTTCYNGVYNSGSHSCATDTVSSPITKTDTYTQLGGSSGPIRQSEIAYDSTYPGSSLVTDDKEYDYGMTVGAAPGTTHLLSDTSTGYAYISGGPIGEPSQIQTVNGSGTVLSNVQYLYDQTSVTATSGTPQHVSVTTGRGNLTNIETQVSSSGTTLYQTFTYYDTGNVKTSTDVSTSSSSPGPPTTYVYGTGLASCYNSFATVVDEPVASMTRGTSWNCAGAAAIKVTDENTNYTQTTYTDSNFWRPSSFTDQTTLNPTQYTYTSYSLGVPASIDAAKLFNGSSSVSDSLVTTDGFGRTVLTQRKQTPTASSYDTSLTAYNPVGLPSQSTMPYSTTASNMSSTSTPAISTTYDALGRPLVVSDQYGGSTTYAYSSNDVVVTVTGSPTPSGLNGSQTFQKSLEYDGLGRLTSVCEMSSTVTGSGTCGQVNAQSGLWTKYTYDGLGNLTGVTQNAQSASGQETRAYTYDLLSRMTSESNPETSQIPTVASPNPNTWTYYYYDLASGTNCAASAGNMTRRVDPAGNSTCYTYDGLHRMTYAGADVPTSTSVCRRFSYDTFGSLPTGVSAPTNPKSRMVEASTKLCSSPYTLETDEWFGYSVRGELTDIYESTPNSAGYYHTTASYWPSGALNTLGGTYLPTLTYSVDAEGRFNSVSDGSGSGPVTGVSYSTSTSNVLGSLQSVAYNSVDYDSYTYDQNTGRMKSYNFSVGSPAATDIGSLGWNPNGTLFSLAIVDGISGTGQNCQYSYDDLGRLSGAATYYATDCGSGTWQQGATYDPFGNITKSGNSSFAPTYNPVSATNQFILAGISYDNDGNMQSDTINTNYTWDPNWGTMTTVTAPGSPSSITVTATYDAFGEVVEQAYSGGGPTYQVLYSPAGKIAIMNGASLVKSFEPLPGGSSAVYTSGPTLAYYRHPDWLGSSRLSTTPSHNIYSGVAYSPFGETYLASLGAGDSPSFTGQNSDTVDSLYDFPGRRYSPAMGRWISPDPAGLAAVDLTDPQTLNRYAYVTNRPLTMIDPMGFDEDNNNCDPSVSDCSGSGDDGPGGGSDQPSDPGNPAEPDPDPDPIPDPQQEILNSLIPPFLTVNVVAFAPSDPFNRWIALPPLAWQEYLNPWQIPLLTGVTNMGGVGGASRARKNQKGFPNGKVSATTPFCNDTAAGAGAFKNYAANDAKISGKDAGIAIFAGPLAPVFVATSAIFGGAAVLDEFISSADRGLFNLAGCKPAP